MLVIVCCCVMPSCYSYPRCKSDTKCQGVCVPASKVFWELLFTKESLLPGETGNFKMLSTMQTLHLIGVSLRVFLMSFNHASEAESRFPTGNLDQCRPERGIFNFVMFSTPFLPEKFLCDLGYIRNGKQICKSNIY